MDHDEIIKVVGRLFRLRMNVNLVSNVLDTPELFWSEPELEGLYNAIRGKKKPPSPFTCASYLRTNSNASRVFGDITAGQIVKYESRGHIRFVGHADRSFAWS